MCPTWKTVKSLTAPNAMCLYLDIVNGDASFVELGSRVCVR